MKASTRSLPERQDEHGHETQRKVVVVLGPSKAGTSVTAGMLHLLGVHMGTHLRAADARNVTGFFEEVDILRLNERILRAAGGTNWRPPDREAVLAQRAMFDGEIRDYVQRRSQRVQRRGRRQIQPWGWKATTTNLTLELFLPHLFEQGDQLHIVAITRDKLDTARSAVAHTNAAVDLDEALALTDFWEREIESLLARHPDVPRLHLRYETLVADPVDAAKRAATFLGLQPTPPQLRAVQRLVLPRDELRRRQRRRQQESALLGRGAIALRLLRAALWTLREEGVAMLLRKTVGVARRALSRP